jgi:hypothetical protein
VELEGKESFVDKHLEKFEEIFKAAVKEAINRGLETVSPKISTSIAALPAETDQSSPVIDQGSKLERPQATKHAKSTVIIHPLPVDLKGGEGRPGLREFYAEKKPANHYEKVASFVYYLSKINNKGEVKFGELLTCYEEVNEKKPSILDIVKNSIRYKGWLEQGSEKYSIRLSISGENFVKFDLPSKMVATQIPTQ